MKRLATAILSAVILAAPLAASAATSGTTTVNSGGGGPSGQYLQGETTVQMTVQSICSSLSTTDALFPNPENSYANPPGTKQTQPFSVTTNCNYNTGAYLAFESGQNCAMDSASGAPIPYSIQYVGASASTDPRAGGSNYCYAGNSAPAAYRFPLGQGDGQTPTFNFQVSATPAYAQAPGTYVDNLNVFLEF